MAPFFVFSNLHLKLSWFTCEGSISLWWGRNCVDWQNRGQLLPFCLSLQSELWFTTDFVFEWRLVLTWQAAVIERKMVTMHRVSYLLIFPMEIHQKLPKLVHLQLPSHRRLRSSRVRIRISRHQSLSSLVESQQARSHQAVTTLYTHAVTSQWPAAGVEC